jgi:outer membrane protein, heavy metal efflux system
MSDFKIRRQLIAVLLAFGSPFVYAQDEGIALELGEAETLAVTRQPLLDGLSAQARAERESAVASAQLPDPQLFGGIQDLPITGSDAGSFTRDSDTQIQVGVMQEFPRAAKRHLRGALNEREADRLDAEHHLAERTVRRDTSLAWLELWRYDQARRLTRASLREAEAQTQAVEIALKTGTATQAELLAARVEVGRLRDAVAGSEQSIEHARNLLSRWIGEAAFRPVCPDLPTSPALPPLDVVMERVRSHPHLGGLRVQIAAAQTAAELAKAEYAPDWRVELGYADRPAFSEMVSLQVGIDLPVFTRNRQDRGLAAALAKGEAAESAVQDALRQLESEARLNRQDSQRLAERLKNYDAELLPQAANRIDAAIAGWSAGRNGLREVLDGRRAALELQMSRLELQHDAAKHVVQLHYLGAYDGIAENTHE